MSGEKTEQPSEKKLDDARSKGEAPKSADVNAAVGLLTMTVCLALASLFAGEHLMKLFAIFYERGVQVQTNAQVQALLYDMLKEGVLTAAPFLGAAVAMALLASFSQVGVRISFDPVTPKFEQVNPAAGLKRIFEGVTEQRHFHRLAAGNLLRHLFLLRLEQGCGPRMRK